MEKHEQLHKHLLWKTIDKKHLADCHIFQVYQLQRQAPDGRKGDFVQLEVPDWVNVLPLITDDQGRECFLLVRQYRHGSGRITVEFPAGAIDHGEMPEAAAARELLEETGYQAESLEQIGAVNPNPAFMTNTSYTFVARGLKKIAEQNLDYHEEVEYFLMPVSEVEEKMGIGEFGNGVMMMALGYYFRWKKRSGESR